MTAWQHADFLGLQRHLTDEESLARDTAARFVDERITPIIGEHFRQGTFPRELVAAMGELGFYGANLTGYGCAGMSNIAYGLIMQELERGDSGIRSFASVQGGLVMHPIFSFGSEEQREYWLPRLARGEAIGCFGLTEANAGSDPGSMRTTAVKDGGGYVLNGEKAWITNGSVADVAVVWARCGNDISGFLVERGTPGFSASDLHGKWSMRASVTSILSFSDCRIPAENLLPKARGLKAALQCLTQARYGIGWGVLGAAADCYQTALAYTKVRKQFGKPIASFQLVQRSLVGMLTELVKGQLFALEVGRLKDADAADFSQVSMLKRNNTRIALDIAREARDLLGANGICDEYPIMRHLMNLETVNTYEGTQNVHTLILGHCITGIPAYGN
ncbi:MAG TPA: acyl-CoA dehydrogenase family protein [Terriglobia bacterium]